MQNRLLTVPIQLVCSHTFISALHQSFAMPTTSVVLFAQVHNSLMTFIWLLHVQGVSPLHIAATSDKPTVVQMLLDYGADAKATDKKVSIKRHANNTYRKRR